MTTSDEQDRPVPGHPSDPEPAPPRPDMPADPDTETRARRPWMPRFLEELAKRGIVSDACAIANISRTQAYTWRHEDPSFAMDWADAHDHAMDLLEAEAVRRAARGVEEPVYYLGEVVGHVTKYSDTLLMFLLNGGRAEKYRPRQGVEVNVKLGEQATDIIVALGDELGEPADA